MIRQGARIDGVNAAHLAFGERVSYCHIVEAFRDMDCPLDLATMRSFFLYVFVNKLDTLTRGTRGRGPSVESYLHPTILFLLRRRAPRYALGPFSARVGVMETLLRPITDADGPQETGFVYGESPTIRGLNVMIAEVAQTDIPVLIVGESGTGKEVYARTIHRLSGALNPQPRLINCGLLEGRRIVSALREVFREGQDSGRPESLILDGIDDLDLATQKVLLSVLSESEWNRHAGQRNLRLISTATKNMENEIESGGFRRELYFRLNGACVRLPALRERKEDIAALAEYFLLKHSRLLGKKTPNLESGALEILREYPWPGNIRELENLTRKIVAVGNAEEALLDLRTARLQQVKTQEKSATSSLKIAAKAASRERERELILGALQRTKWNRKRAARELQISYKSLLYKIKQIELPETILQERGRK